MNAATPRGDNRRENVATAHMLAEKLRITDEPLTEPERNALAQLLYTITDRIDSHPRDAFNQLHAWATVSTSFDVRMRILRGDLPEEAA